jgi:hypothetical protein
LQALRAVEPLESEPPQAASKSADTALKTSK